MDDPAEERKRLTEKINFAIQGMSENAQFSIAIAVGVFGILVIFVTINDHKGESQTDSIWNNALWTKSIWVRITGIIYL